VKPLWEPTSASSSQLAEFARFVGQSSWEALSAWSLSPEFWATFVRWSGLVVEGALEPVRVGHEVETARFFPSLRLSYVENLLAAGADSDVALVGRDESGTRVTLTRAELRDRVRRLAAGLRARGVLSGDRVVAVARNTVETVVACLGACALGATWSSTSPDLGAGSLHDRFAPLAPTVLMTAGAYAYQGAGRPIADKMAVVATNLPSLRLVVALDEAALQIEGAVAMAELERAEPLAAFPRLPFDQPLFIVFSSGTTGPPKCIVHGAGGTLVEHVKEHRLHGDLRSGDRLYFQTSVGWMMWNWQLSALASGATVVLRDGSVSFPDDDALWRLCAEERVTVFGTSPTYLQYCRDAGIVPRQRNLDLSSLREVWSTGSILSPAVHAWATSAVGDLPVQSLSGGTDILGCFFLGAPTRPVWSGELSSVSLGLDVRVAEPGPDGIGELVCASPFPSRPLGLVGDDGGRFFDAYFSQRPGMWTHGDFVELTSRGTAKIHGRSDGILNVRGVRIGPAEIYAILEGMPNLAATMAVEQRAADEPGGSRLVLLVVLAEGTLDRPLMLRIKKELSQRGSMAHVPSVIWQLSALPTTRSGKRSERAARDVLDGKPASNRDALSNPEVLDELAALATTTTTAAT